MSQLEPYDEWPDIELTVVAWLTQQLGGIAVQTETDDTLADDVPLVQVQLVPGGSSDGVTEESVVDVTSWAADRAGMWALGKRAHAAMLRLSTQRVNGWAIDWVSVDNGLGEVPYSNPRLRRAIGTYRLTTRAQATAV